MWDSGTKGFENDNIFSCYFSFIINISYPDLHVRNMHHISILVFGLYNDSSWPSTANVIFVQDQRCLLGVCVRVWLQPPKRKKRTMGEWQNSKWLICNAAWDLPINPVNPCSLITWVRCLTMRNILSALFLRSLCIIIPVVMLTSRWSYTSPLSTRQHWR